MNKEDVLYLCARSSDSPYVYSIKHYKIKSDILSNSLAMNGQKVLSCVG